MIQEYHSFQGSQADLQGVGGGRQPGADSALPCLSSNNSIRPNTQEDQARSLIHTCVNLLSPYHRKQAHTLTANVERLIMQSGVNNVGFMTLTFPDNVTDYKEAYRRYRSLNTNVLCKDPRFGIKIAVKEPQKRGAWHYHILIQLSEDIRTGFDFEAVARGDYSSASPYLRELWSIMRKEFKKYGFGRTELLPVKSNVYAMSYYLGKYISKGIEKRESEHVGVRLVNYPVGWLRNSPKFQWATDNSKEWRRKLQLFAEYCGCSDMYQLSEKLGPGWAYKYCDSVINIEVGLEESGGVMCTEHSAPEIARIVSNSQSREKEDIARMNIVKRKSALRIARDQSKKVVSESIVRYRSEDDQRRLWHRLEVLHKKKVTLEDPPF